MTITDNPDLMARLLIQSVTDYAIYLLTPQGIVANWNPGAERAKGYTASEIVGHHFALFYTAHERAAAIPMFNLGVARATGPFRGRRVAHPQGRHRLQGACGHRCHS